MLTLKKFQKLKEKVQFVSCKSDLYPLLFLMSRGLGVISSRRMCIIVVYACVLSLDDTSKLLHLVAIVSQLIL